MFEIGPGSGQLTKYLLQQCDHVVCIPMFISDIGGVGKGP